MKLKKVFAVFFIFSLAVPALGFTEKNLPDLYSKELKPLDIIQTALKNNPDLLALESDLSASEAIEDQQTAQRLPKINLKGGYTHFEDSQRLSPATFNGEQGIFSKDFFNTDLVMTMPLYTGGNLLNKSKSAKLAKESKKFRLLRAKHQTAYNIKSIFYLILVQQQKISSLEFSKKAIEEQLERINQLIKSQKAPAVDRMRAEVRLADIRQKILKEKNSIQVMKCTLINIMGTKCEPASIKLYNVLLEPEEFLVPELDEILSSALQQRPDFLEAVSAIEAEKARLESLKGKFYPFVSLKASYGKRYSAGTRTGNGDDNEDYGSIGLSFDLPVFQGGQLKSELRHQEAVIESHKKRLQSLKNKIRLDIETALSELSSSEKRLVTIKMSLIQAQESLRIEKEKYKAGKGTIVDVLDSQSALLEAETVYYSVLGEIKTAKAKFDFASGKNLN
jgi:outer membrane protein TolC